MRLAIALAAALLFAVSAGTRAGAAGDVYVGHGVAMYGDLKYGPDFTHFDYADPNAPKGGKVRLHAIGTYDSLNPFILKGVTAAGLQFNLFESLMMGSSDEPFSEYGLIAESIEMPKDRSWVIFTLRPQARWHDGTPITADDVIFSLETLRTKGHPFYRAYYASVVSAEKLGERRVKFSFGTDVNRELPLIMGQIPILSKAYYSTHDFEKTTLEAPMGSGPYRVESVDPGRSITYRRVADYWGADLPVRRGQNNFDVIRIDYYRDPTVAMEAFKAHEYDFRQENTAKVWATAYVGPPFDAGLIKKEEIAHSLPTGMQGFFFNTRRTKFKDRRVRAALAYAFDFEWTNKNLFNGAYTRTTSYFSNSELASSGLPSGDELALLEPFRDRLPSEVFTREYMPPRTDGSGNARRNLRTALKMLRKAGWTIKDGVLVNPETGEPLEIEFLIIAPAFERIIAPFIKNLEKLGVVARVRLVDTAQYQNRLDSFDFDVIVGSIGQSLSPGNEQRNFWTSRAADTRGSRNYAGIKDPVVDALVEKVIAASDRKSLVAATRALDRVLLWGHYVVPQWHIRHFRVAYWNKFSRPAITPKYSLGFDTWWVDPAKEEALAKKETATVTQ
ncbi:MAG: extracellular solute-binding protein [Alphaproteobacteria bacterium]